MVEIPITTQKEEFKEFLNRNGNVKIVFSAPFGSGKTTFLKAFFDSEENNNERAIFVYPVNYSVASNEDIFELIKYDVLSQMLRWDDITNYIADLSQEWSLYRQFVNDPMKVIIPIAEAMGKLGGMLGQVANISKGLYELKKELEKVAKEGDEGDTIDQFMIEIESKTGSLYQKDIITLIIQSILKRVKDSENNINTVLVIDDLDRIDPEHLFRILNILAAHSDIENEDSNKFGFDKIITVFDIENVKQIFHTKYGVKVDFIGYINKFYSKEVFNFDITWEITDKLFEMFRDTSIEYTDEENTKFWGGYAYQRIIPILILFIQKRKVSIRDLKKMNSVIKANENYAIKYNKSNDDIRWSPNYPYFIAYEFFIKLLGGRDELNLILSELKGDNYQYLIKQRISSSNLDFEQIFIDYISLCLGARLNKDNQYVDSELLNIRLYYDHIGGHYFRINGAFCLKPPATIKMSPSGVPLKYDMNVVDIHINIGEILLEIINKIEEKIHS